MCVGSSILSLRHWEATLGLQERLGASRLWKNDLESVSGGSQKLKSVVSLQTYHLGGDLENVILGRSAFLFRHGFR